MADVFISSARSSEKVAQRVADRLSAAGYSVWRDDQLPAHLPYGDVIDEHLRQARCVVVLWSADAVQSQWVRAEAEVARGEGKLAQARLDDATLPLPFDQIQHADLRGWKGGADHPGWRKVEASVRALAGAPSQTPPPASPAAPRRQIPVALLVTVAVAVLVAAGAAWWFGTHSQGQPEAAAGRVAILPLASDASTRDLAQETQDQIVSRLNAVGVPPLDGKAGAGQRPALLVDGRIQREGAMLRARVRVVGGQDGAVLWSGLFERPDGRADALPDQIAAKVADIVDCGVKSVAPGARMSASARATYLRFCDLRREDTGAPATFDAARAVTEQAPEFAAGWSALALSAAFSLNELPAQQQAAARATAIAAADRAIKLDANAGAAYLARALLVPPSDWTGRARWLDRAIANADHSGHAEAATVYTIAGGQLRRMGRVADYQTLVRRSPGLDPNSAAKAATAIEALASAGESTQAASALGAADRAWPGNRYLRTTRVNLAALADPGAALRLLEDPATRPKEIGDAGVAAWRAFAAAQASGVPGTKADAAGRLVQALGSGAIDPELGVRALLSLDRTMEVDRFYRSKLATGRPLETGPLFSAQAVAFRRTPQFVALMRDIGLGAYWRDSGKWPDFCAEPGLPYRCTEAFKAPA